MPGQMTPGQMTRAHNFLKFQNMELEIAGIWVISRLANIGKGKILASRYISNSALVFDPRYEHNEENVQLSLPSESESSTIGEPFPIWMKLADAGPDFQSSQVGNDINAPSEPMFGISIIDAYAVNLGKSSRRCCVALVLMGTKLHIGAMQNLARRGLKILRGGLKASDDYLSGMLFSIGSIKIKIIEKFVCRHRVIRDCTLC